VLSREDDPPDPPADGDTCLPARDRLRRRPAVLSREDDPPDPHDRGWGRLCGLRWDDPRCYGFAVTGERRRSPLVGFGLSFARLGFQS